MISVTLIDMEPPPPVIADMGGAAVSNNIGWLAKFWRVPQGGMTKKGRRRLLSGREIGRRPFYHIGIWQGSEYTAARR
jgi:hypothetical protein